MDKAKLHDRSTSMMYGNTMGAIHKVINTFESLQPSESSCSRCGHLHWAPLANVMLFSLLAELSKLQIMRIHICRTSPAGGLFSQEKLLNTPRLASKHFSPRTVLIQVCSQNWRKGMEVIKLLEPTSCLGCPVCGARGNVSTAQVPLNPGNMSHRFHRCHRSSAVSAVIKHWQYCRISKNTTGELTTHVSHLFHWQSLQLLAQCCYEAKQNESLVKCRQVLALRRWQKKQPQQPQFKKYASYLSFNFTCPTDGLHIIMLPIWMTSSFTRLVMSC